MAGRVITHTYSTLVIHRGGPYHSITTKNLNNQVFRDDKQFDLLTDIVGGTYNERGYSTDIKPISSP